ncbi:MAG: hypothetical protein ACRC2O_07830, partial [Chitinophagaceae bacterium]
VTINYHLNKVIGENETGFLGQKDSTYRKEAWELILAGGGLFNNLDYSFTVGHENGTYKYYDKQPGGGTPEYRNQLGYLKRFIESFDFAKMRPDSTVCTGGIPIGLKAYMLVEDGIQYAFYIMAGRSISPQFNLPKGTYIVDWLNPVSGTYSHKKEIKHKGGKLTIQSPETSADIALRIKRKGKAL